MENTVTIKATLQSIILQGDDLLAEISIISLK